MKMKYKNFNNDDFDANQGYFFGNQDLLTLRIWKGNLIII